MKISVITTAYNHQKTLQRAINSVLAQTLEVEHHILDDTETKYGMMTMFKKGFFRCSCDYICFCDGDDYWIDKRKLEKQVAYMEANKDCGLCTTKGYTEVDGKRYNMAGDVGSINKNMSFDSLLKGNANLYAQTYMLRKSDFDKYIDFDMFSRKFNAWDYPIVLELIKHTKFHTLNFYSAVYTKNTESVTNTSSRLKRLKYILGNHKIKWYYILKYGCKLSTITFLIYRFTRDIYSVVFKRW